MRGPLLTLILGVIVLTTGVVQHAGNPTIVARLPLPLEPGTTEMEFTVPHGGVHEIEIEVLLDSLDEEAYEAVRIKSGSSPIDLGWEVREASGPRVAAGDSREFSYFPSWVGTGERLRDLALRRADHRGLGAGTVARGVGSFRAQAGDRMVLRADARSIPAGVLAAQPHLVVRVQRAVARSRQSGPDRWVGAGVVLLLAALGLGAVRRLRG